VAEFEPGGITQQVTAFKVNLNQPQQSSNRIEDKELKHFNKPTITFLDTPGHAAFFVMRQMGANVSDFILLVIAANEGIKSQTEEVINLAKENHIPIILAINKIDIATPKQIAHVYTQFHKRKLLPKTINHSTNPSNNPTAEKKPSDQLDDEDYPIIAAVEISASTKKI